MAIFRISLFLYDLIVKAPIESKRHVRVEVLLELFVRKVDAQLPQQVTPISGFLPK